VPTYYTYKKDVPLLPGQTLAFTPGRGYYAKGTPQPPSKHAQGQLGPSAQAALIQPRPAVKRAAPSTPTRPVGTIFTQPVPASTAPKTETAAVSRRPPAQATPPDRMDPARAPQLLSDAASSQGYGSRYYTYRRQVPLRRGQVIGFRRGRGYYAYYPMSKITLPTVAPFPATTPGPLSLHRVPARAPNVIRTAGLASASMGLTSLPPPVRPQAPRELSLLDPSYDDFISASWNQRLNWITEMSKLFNGWFNNIIGILDYFRGSHFFANDARVKAADGYVLWAIAEGYRGYLGYGPGDLWTQFMTAEKRGNISESVLREYWGKAEQHGVDFSTYVSQGYPQTDDQAAMYDLFVYFGNQYRWNVAHNDSAPIFGFFVGSDPRRDRGRVLEAAKLLELAYRHLP
jgi:hypothetical protein